MYFHHVLITTDLSEVSNRAVEFIAKKIPAEVEQITLLTVIDYWPLTMMPGEYVIDPKTIEEYNTYIFENRKKELFEVAKKYFHEQKVQCVVLSSTDSAAKEICKYAKDNKCDLIVIGSHGAGFVENLFLGSTVQKVLKNAQCPALVIPNRDSK